MSIVTRRGVPFDVNPSLAIALDDLASILRDYHYSEHAVGRIVAYTARQGTPSGCPELDPEDECDAEAVYVEGLPEVPMDSPAWDREDAFLVVEWLAAGVHPLPFAAEPDDDTGEWPVPAEADAPDASPHARFPGIASLAERMALPPLSGGSPEPTAEDLSDYGAWSEDLDRRREMLSWYERNPIEAFNAVRPD